jgi:tripartite ATP-independent transporter DctP family solute receptor
MKNEKRVLAVFVALLLFFPAAVVFANGSTEVKPEVWRFGHVEPENITIGDSELIDPYHAAAMEFKRIIEAESDGKIEVEIFPAGQLGGEREMLEALKLGSLELAITSSAPLSAWDSSVMVFDLPFIFNDLDTAREILDGPIGEAVFDNLTDDGIKGLAYGDNAFRHMITTKATIKTPSDIKGMKFRVMESPMYIAMFKALGASATPLPSTEVYMALQTGVVDGYEHPLFPYMVTRNFEVAKHLAFTNHTLSVSPITMCYSKWSGLSDEMKEIVARAAESARDVERKANDEINKRAIGVLTGAGVAINDVDNELFKAAMDGVYLQFRNEIGAELIDQVKNYSK